MEVRLPDQFTRRNDKCPSQVQSVGNTVLGYHRIWRFVWLFHIPFFSVFPFFQLLILISHFHLSLLVNCWLLLISLWFLWISFFFHLFLGGFRVQHPNIPVLSVFSFAFKFESPNLWGLLRYLLSVVHIIIPASTVRYFSPSCICWYSVLSFNMLPKETVWVILIVCLTKAFATPLDSIEIHD